jgi:hypothetical protein
MKPPSLLSFIFAGLLLLPIELSTVHVNRFRIANHPALTDRPQDSKTRSNPN